MSFSEALLHMLSHLLEAYETFSAGCAREGSEAGGGTEVSALRRAFGRQRELF